MATQPSPPPEPTLPPARPTGALIVAASLLMIAFMAYHPVIHARGMAELLAEVERQAAANAVVHGALIAVLLALVGGLSGLAARLGMGSLCVRAAVVATAAGAFALAAAALVNGFIVPEFLLRHQGRPPADLDALRPSLALARAANQACSRLGVVALSAALLLWSAPLARRPGAPRAVGALGGLAGGLAILLLLAGRLPMNVHGFGAFVLAQAAWGVAVGALLLRGRL